MIVPTFRTLLRRYRTVGVSMSTHSRQLDTNLPEVKAVLNTDVLRLCRNFIDQNHEIRVVGGAVRDMLMKREPKDIDLSTTATPEEMIEVFRNNEIRYIETGLQHGTLTAHLDEMDYEITTLRIDTETDGIVIFYFSISHKGCQKKTIIQIPNFKHSKGCKRLPLYWDAIYNQISLISSSLTYLKFMF